MKNGWSRAVLMHFIDTQLHARQGKAVSNFAVALPEPDSDLAKTDAPRNRIVELVKKL